MSQKQARQENDDFNASGDSMDSACVVCFKNVDIYSIGNCDHPVCYECSTRMRVLCKQNECPICRQGLSKVYFTNEKKSYRELEVLNRSEYYNKKYQICFANIQIQKAFYDLLDHPCPKCEDRSFSKFELLKGHVRKEHELFYCDICTDNLKIFSFERRCYNRQELALHRRNGDPDNTSHRGHPLCQYCDSRYLDRDELFRHLRREHYYCHFCDADGANHFYGNVDTLRDHFRSEHYLCEEGECAREQFTSVFRTDIDLRAHIANVHGKSMGKQQAKQARTLQLEITLGPRGRGQQDHTSAHLRSRGNEYDDEPPIGQPAPTQNARVIDARDEQEFPSLGGAGSSGMMSLVPASMSIRAKAFGPAGLARTKENFPALGNGGNSKSDAGPSTQNNTKFNKPASALLKNPNVAQKTNNSSMVIHVSNRPNKSRDQVPSQQDFPALPLNSRAPNNVNNTLYRSSSAVNVTPSSSKQRQHTSFISKQQPKASIKDSKQQAKLFEDRDDFFLPSTTVNLNAVAAKHRSLVDEYVSVAQPNSKFSLVQKEDVKPKKDNSNNAMKLDTLDFPALAPTASASQPLWVKSQKQQDRENRKSKVAPPPLLNNHANGENPKKAQDKKDKKKSADVESQNGNQKDKNKQNKIGEKKQSDAKKVENGPTKTNDTKQNAKQSREKKSPSDNNNKLNDRENSAADRGSGTITSSTSSSSLMSAPPGFHSKGSDVKTSAPPGFKSVTLNSIAKPSNNMTFTNSLGENFSIIPNHQYSPPPDSLKRNQELVHHFESVLQSPDAVAEFRYISQKFREGIYKPSAYFEHCQAALRDKFDDIFPELLVLLPDISKQQELYLVYSQHLNSLFATQKQQKIKSMLSVCKTCKQIVISYDLMAHMLVHNLDNNFPSLGNAKSTTA